VDDAGAQLNSMLNGRRVRHADKSRESTKKGRQNVKRIVVLLLLVTGMNSFAGNLLSGRVLTPSKNDYVIYYDHRFGDESLFGVQFLGGMDYRVRYVNLATKEELTVRCTINETPETYALGARTYEKGSESVDSMKKTLLPLLLIRSQDDKIDKSKFPADALQTLTLGEGSKSVSQTLTYKYWVPVFGLYEMRVDGSMEESMVLMAFGKPGDTDDGKFLATNGFPQSRPGPQYSIESRSALKLKVGSLDFELDKNWEVTQGNSLIMKRQTPRDAFISFDSYSYDPTKATFEEMGAAYGYLKMIGLGLSIAPSSVDVRFNDKAVLVGFDVLNEADMMYSHVAELFVNQGNGQIMVIYVNTYTSLYQKNRSYFDGIAFQFLKK
jgi:hypothetical protein